MQSANGTTATMEAAGSLNSTYMNVLLEAGADVTVEDEDGETALSIAIRNGADVCARLLRQRLKPGGAAGRVPSDLSAFFASLNLTPQQVTAATDAGLTLLEDLDGITKEDLVGGGVAPLVASKIVRGAVALR